MPARDLMRSIDLYLYLTAQGHDFYRVGFPSTSYNEEAVTLHTSTTQCLGIVTIRWAATLWFGREFRSPLQLDKRRP